LDVWMQAVFECNRWIDEMAPWSLRKTDLEKMRVVLARLFLCIRDLAITLRPIAPDSMDRLLDHMGVVSDERDFEALLTEAWYDRLRASGFRLAPPTPIFPRLEMPSDATT
jgi:methionyl-tRNA synthetase